MCDNTLFLSSPLLYSIIVLSPVQASAGKSLARFKITQVSTSTEPRMRLEQSKKLACD